MTAVLEAKGAVVRRGPREVLHGVSLALTPGDAVALVGPNAAGKSTLVRALAGLLRLERGEVLLQGRPVAAWDRDARARTLALVTPEDDAPATLTVEDRVALGRYPHRGPFRPLTREDHASVAEALAVTGIESLRRRVLETLSAGERQLAALARGLAQQPRVLLLDEPTQGLSPEDTVATSTWAISSPSSASSTRRAPAAWRCSPSSTTCSARRRGPDA